MSLGRGGGGGRGSSPEATRAGEVSVAVAEGSQETEMEAGGGCTKGVGGTVMGWIVGVDLGRYFEFVIFFLQKRDT